VTAAQAWALFLPELHAVTVDNWTEDDYEDDPDKRQLAADIEAGNITPGVLDEIQDCTTRDWCAGRVRTAALHVLAANGGLDEFDPNATYWPRRPRTMVILGKRWLV
jgi:hypothetical protein